jgi:hypothetical protein
VAHSAYELRQFQKGQYKNKEIIKDWAYIFGARESVVSVVVKLANTLTKIVTMEKKFMSEDKTIKATVELSEDDKAIVKRYEDRLGIKKARDLENKITAVEVMEE